METNGTAKLEVTWALEDSEVILSDTMTQEVDEKPRLFEEVFLKMEPHSESEETGVNQDLMNVTINPLPSVKEDHHSDHKQETEDTTSNDSSWLGLTDDINPSESTAHLMKQLPTRTGEKLYQCEICSKIFNHNSNLKQHLRSHSSEKPFQCGTCSKTFRYSSNLKDHLRSHSGEKPFLCGTCNKTFSRSSILKVHLSTHSGQKPFQCGMCKKTFSHSSRLKDHLRIHLGKNSNQCGNSNEFNRPLKEHLNISRRGSKAGKSRIKKILVFIEDFCRPNNESR